MPLPLILGVAAGIAALGGIGSGISGAVKMKDANDTMNSAKIRNDENIERFEKKNKQTTRTMDALGKKELEVLKSFEDFSLLIEKIHNRPEFASYNKDGVSLPQYDPQKLSEVSVGAGVLLGGIGGAAAGTAGGFAAAGATTAAVMALGTASTGTAIASLSGVAATNATLAALGGGALAAGGGGMALGTAILGASTLGIGLLVGGIIFNVTGTSLSSKADEAWSEMKNNEEKINTIISYLEDLSDLAKKYKKSFDAVGDAYYDHLADLSAIIEDNNKTNWDDFTEEEKLVTQNTVLLVSLLYQMGKIKLVKKDTNDDGLNEINHIDARRQMRNADKVLSEVA